MSSYLTNFFLDKKILIWINNNKNKHRSIFKLTEKLNSDCYSFLSNVKINKKDKRQVVVSCLFLRCLEYFQSLVLHSERGMVNSARVMLRSLIETLFTLRAVARNEEALELYILNDELQRLKMINKALTHKSEALEGFRTEKALKLKDEIEKKINEKNIKKLSTEEMSCRAELHDWYLTVYAETSRAVHASIRDMEHYLVLDQTEKIEEIQFVPTVIDLEIIMATGASALNMALEQFTNSLGIKQEVCNAYVLDLGKFFQNQMGI